MGGQTDSQVSSQVHASPKKTHSKAGISRISLANNNRLMDVTHLALTWVEWPNVGKLLASTCVQEIDDSFLCVCPVIDHESRHNIVKVAVDPRGDSRVDPHGFQIHASVCILTIKINQ